MKVLLSARHSVVRFVIAALLVAGVISAALLSSASVAAAGHTGQALALRSALSHSGKPFAQSAQNSSAALGRFAYPRNYYQRLRQSGLHADKSHPNASASTILINEGVQTFDVFAPPPGFQPGDGPLTPTNLHPVWTSDGRYIIFSSNRSSNGDIAADGHYHLWSISASGDNPLDLSATTSLHQITSGNGDEFFPAIYTATNAQLAFVSTDANAGNPNGVQNLYALPNFDASTTTVDVDNLTSLTIRDSGTPNDLNTHFAEVDRPTWSPDGSRLIFSAIDSDGTFIGTHHLWSLFINSGGGQPDSNGPSPTNPPARLTTGPADDTDPAWTPDASVDLIAFATTAASGYTAGSPGNPAVSSAPTATPLRSIYAVKSDGTVPQQITTAGQDDFGPAWNVNPTFVGYLTFARGASTTANHGIYFLTGVYQSGASVVSPEVSADAIQINTDDLPSRGNPNNPGNIYTKVYPSWSPLAVGTTPQPASVVYSSNRSVTYNDPTTGNPVEAAISLAQGTDGVGANYFGLLISRFDDVDPPTLLPYSAGENIHVTNGTDNTPRRNGDITPGSPVTFTVRLSNREAGVDDNNVYIQIKDPDSKYQDSKGLEHKVFTQDVTDSINQTAAGQPDSFPSTFAGFGPDPADPTTPSQYSVGSNTFDLYNGGAGGGPLPVADNSPLFDQLSLSADPAVETYGNLFAPRFNVSEAQQIFTVGGNQFPVQERGAVAGQDGGTAISVGRDDGSTTPITITTGSPAVTNPLGDGDPANFQSYGQEYECQFVDANYNFDGSLDTNQNGNNDYGTPFYLAGVDDQGSHTGTSHQPPTDVNSNLEWLHLTRAAAQDGQGGVLYTTTWTTPTSASDYYLDVIAYDKAVEPLTPATTAANWRIYDNIWGFSTQPFQGGKDILVVSDNTLGQKFVGSTFGGNGLENIPPIFYGAESYYTDIDISLLPNAIYRYVSVSGDTPTFTASDGTSVLLADTLPYPEVIDLSNTLEPGQPAVLNGLGVNSYSDSIVLQQTSNVGGVAVPVSQQYSLWRILARGAVDPQVLNAYSPTSQPQPAVNDPLTNFKAAAATVPVNHRCVIWTSPYAGDLPLNTVGSIADGTTQNELRAFVLGGTSGSVTFSGGGRLFLSGGNVANTVADGGTVPAANTTGSFITDVLNASYVATVGTGANVTVTGGNQNLSGNASNLSERISGDSFFNPSLGLGILQDFFTQSTGTLNVFNYSAPNANPLLLGNNYVRPIINMPTLWRTDGSLDQLGPIPSNFGGGTNLAQGQIGLIALQNGATTDAAFNCAGPGFSDLNSGTGPTLVYKSDSGPNGARVVFGSFGLEGIGIEYYKQTINTKDFFFARNQRPNILHNVVDFLRTATFTGTITQGNSGGQSAANAVVYLIPDQGTLPSVRQTYSALTAGDGSYQIQGVEPGGYFIVAYKTGFSRIESPAAKVVEGDTTQTFNLNLTPVPPGSITGKVQDSNGNGVSDAALTFTSTDGLTQVTGTSRADGTYTITGVPPTTYNSSVTAPGYTTVRVPDAPTPNPFAVTSSQTTVGVNFTLTAIPGTIGGIVKDDFTNQPIPGVKVTIMKPASTTVVASFTTGAASTPAVGPTGDGSLINYSGPLTQGTYTVTITPPPNYSNPLPVTGTVTIISNQFTRQDFTLTSDLGQIGGLVNDAGTGKPFAGATVTATDATGKVFAVGTTSGTATAPGAPTGDNAPLNFTGNIPAGTYTITVAAANYFTQTFPNIVINVHQFTRVPTGGGTISLVSTLGTLGGLVREFYPNGQGAAIAGATVTVTDANKNIVFGPFTTPNAPTASPNDGGITGDGGNVNYDTLVTLPEGIYTVTASAANFTTTSVAVQVTHNKFTRGDVALHSTQGTVGGLITDANTGKPLGGATVTITTADTNATTVFGPFVTAADGSTTTPPSGRYGDGSPVNFAATITAGTYNVTISKQGAGTTTRPDYNTVTFPITVAADQFTRSDKALIYAYGTLGGLIEDSYSQQLLAGGTVTVADATGSVVATLSGRNSTTSPAAPIGDGSPLNYSTGLTLYGGTGTVYTVTASATNHTTSAPIRVTVVGSQFKRQDFALVSTMGAVGGLVLDASNGGIVSGATVTISDTTGAIVTTFNTTAATSTSAAPTGDGSPVNYTGPLTQGTYSATVTKPGYNTSAAQSFTITPNHFSRIDFSGATYGLPPVHVFAAGYNFFSVPYDYASVGVGFDQLFGTLNTGTRSAPSAGSNRSHIFVWSPQLVQYVLDPQAPADGLHLGQGYWVYLLNSHEVTVAASATTAKSVTVNLHLGWNQIGVPSLTAISVSNLTFNNPATGGTISFADASGSVYRLVSTPLYGYNGSAYFTVTAGSSLQPWQSYWIYAFADTSVNIPTS